MKRSSGSNFAAAKDPGAKIQEILAILHKWGIHTLGQFTALDKEEIGGRLGSEAVRMWERANGQSNRLLKLVRPPESFEENFEFDNEIEIAEPLLFMLRRFLEQLSLRLSGIYLVAKELRLQITFANKQIYERVFKIPDPTNDIEVLFRMLHTHLENFKSEHPITAVALTAQPTKPAKQQFGLFETTLRSPHQLSETLARLSALLGTDRVGTPVLEDTYQPDAFRMEPFSSTGFQSASRTDSSRGEPGGQAGVRACNVTGRQDACPPHSQDGCATLVIALRRFRPSPPASVLLDDDRPAHVWSDKILEGVRAVGAVRGPYLISGNWWDEKRWTCAEWDLQLEKGELVRCHESGGIWKIDGVYD